LSWQLQSSNQAPGVIFYAGTADKTAALSLGVGLFTGSWSAFVSHLYGSARQAYLVQDPKASIRSRTVTLPGGRAFQVIVSWVAHDGTHAYPEYIVHYDLLKNGRQYDFEYICGSKLASAYVPVFAASARSIRFK
jgi:hypothetical protein